MTSRTNHNNPDNNGHFDLTYHYEMLADNARIQPIKESIQRTCKGKVVLESGTGSGLLSILAAKAGATRVYAVETDPQMAAFARKNISNNGLEDIIELIEGDSRKLTPEDLDHRKVDVIIAENLSTWQVTEPQIPIMNHLCRFLKEGGVAIPGRVSNYFELAESKFAFEDSIVLRTHYFQFSGIQPPVQLSEKVLFSTLEFARENPAHFHGSLPVTVSRDGILNSLRLTSPVRFAEDIGFGSSDSLMPPVVVPLANDLPVKRGDTVRVEIKYAAHSRWPDFYAAAFLEKPEE